MVTISKPFEDNDRYFFRRSKRKPGGRASVNIRPLQFRIPRRDSEFPLSTRRIYGFVHALVGHRPVIFLRFCDCTGYGDGEGYKIAEAPTGSGAAITAFTLPF